MDPRFWIRVIVFVSLISNIVAPAAPLWKAGITAYSVASWKYSENVAITTPVQLANVTPYVTNTASSTLAYTFTFDPADGSFAFDASTGIIYVNRALNYERTNPYAPYKVNICMIDGYNTGQVCTTQTVTGSPTAFLQIEVEDVNEKPYFSASVLPKKIRVREDIGNNTSLYTAGPCIDPDIVSPNQDFKESIQSVYPSKWTSMFVINTDTGELIYLNPPGKIDYETRSSFQIQICCTDTHGLKSCDLLEIEIINVNEAPQFVGALVTACDVPENTAVGTTLGCAPCEAIDEDTIGGTVHVSALKYDIAGKWAEYFQMNTVYANGASTGHLVQKKLIDYEATAPDHTINLKVYVRDPMNLRSSNEYDITINVLDQNDNTPVCFPPSYQYPVYENATVNTLLTTISCTDADSGTKTYSIENNVNAANYFQVLSNGQLTVKHPADLETTQVLIYNVVFSEGSPATSATATVTATIIAYNDNRPTFTKSFFNCDICSNATISSSVCKITAQDNDVTSSVISYEFVGSVPKFSLVGTDGIIRVKEDVVVNEKYMVWALARDNDNAGTVKVSTAVPIRIDTFNSCDYLIKFVIDRSLGHFTDTRITAFEDAITTSCSPCVGRICKIESNAVDSSWTDVYAYALVNSNTDSYSNKEVTKTYIAKSTMLSLFQADATLETPSSLATSTPFQDFPAKKVTDGCNTAVDFWTTPGGIAVICLLVLLGLAIIAGLLYLLITKVDWSKVKCVDKCIDPCRKKPPGKKFIQQPQTQDTWDFRYANNKPLVPDEVVS